MKAVSVDKNEISHFAKDSAHWWDESGPFAPLHRLNPVRLGYIKSQLAADKTGAKALTGLKILDIGCGGGLVCEPLARMGASVTGIDADANAIAVAKAHAEKSNLEIDYRNSASEDIKGTFDAVLALEIVEHVADIPAFIQSCAKLCKPGGMVIFSTLNRTPRSFALGVVAAEHILRWVPRGTHDWKKFVKPSELVTQAEQNGLTAADLCGLTFNPLAGDFALNPHDLSVNYFLTARKQK